MESPPASHPRPWRPRSPSALYSVLPVGEIVPHHEIEVGASRERVWEALLAQDLAASPLGKVLLFLRGYGRRVFAPSEGSLPDKLRRFGFVKLIEITRHELVFAIVGQFWRRRGGLRPAPFLHLGRVPRLRRGRLGEGGLEPEDRGARRRPVDSLDRDPRPDTRNSRVLELSPLLASRSPLLRSAPPKPASRRQAAGGERGPGRVGMIPAAAWSQEKDR